MEDDASDGAGKCLLANAITGYCAMWHLVSYV